MDTSKKIYQATQLISLAIFAYINFMLIQSIFIVLGPQIVFDSKVVDSIYYSAEQQSENMGIDFKMLGSVAGVVTSAFFVRQGSIRVISKEEKKVGLVYKIIISLVYPLVIFFGAIAWYQLTWHVS